MSYMVTIGNIASLEEYRDLMLPVAQAEHDRVANLPTEPNHYYFNFDPEFLVMVAANEFMKKLPKEYVKRTSKPNALLYPSRRVTLAKTVPHDVVVDALRKTTIMNLGD